MKRTYGFILLGLIIAAYVSAMLLETVTPGWVTSEVLPSVVSVAPDGRMAPTTTLDEGGMRRQEEQGCGGCHET